MSNETPYITLYVRFRNQKDLEEFADIIGEPTASVPSKKNNEFWFSLSEDNEESLDEFF